MKNQELKRCPGAVKAGKRLTEPHFCSAGSFTSSKVSKCQICNKAYRAHKVPVVPFGPEIDPTKKRCTGARAHKTKDELHPAHYELRENFTKNRTTNDGLGTRCKACHRLVSKSKTVAEPEYFREYDRRNAEQIRSNVRNRRAKAKNAHDEDVQRLQLLELHGSICYLGCGRDVLTLETTWHLEHVIPTSRGGRHSYSNIRVSCQDCNLSKWNKTILEFLGNDPERYDNVDPEAFNRTMHWHAHNTPEIFTQD